MANNLENFVCEATEAVKFKLSEYDYAHLTDLSYRDFALPV